MAVLIPRPLLPMNTGKHTRRTATAVMAGTFDIRPSRDVLTSLLNGIGPYKFVERDEEVKRNKKKEKRERERERKRAKLASAKSESLSADFAMPSTSSVPMPLPSASGTSSFWRARPAIHIPSMQQRSVSVTPPPFSSPPPMISTPSTPGPSISSSTSRTSSKRPRTPNDDEDLDQGRHSPSPQQRPRKKRTAARKGWKGWVPGSPPPSEKLIKLDEPPVLQERRTRSGKNFDAIGVGKEGWVQVCK